MRLVLFLFGGYRLDDARVSLTGPDGQVHCEPQVFGVLVHLVRNRHRVVPKEELLDVVWGNRFVSESALTSRLKAARRAIGDDGRAQHSIKTVHGLGYHFVAEVVESSDKVGPTVAEAPTVADAPTTALLALPALRTELIGRDGDLAGVLATVEVARVTTIVGPGGVGKTTLALAAAHRSQAAHTDGAVFVDLVAAGSHADVLRSV